MPAIDTEKAGRKQQPKRKPKVIYAPQIKGTGRKAAAAVPGVGAATRPRPKPKPVVIYAPQIKVTPKAQAKPRRPRQPTAAERVTIASRARAREATLRAENQSDRRARVEARRQVVIAVPGLGAGREKAARNYAAGLAASLNGPRYGSAPVKTKRRRFEQKAIGPGGMVVSRASLLPGGSRGEKIVRNIPRDAAEIVVTMPSSLYRTAEVAVTEPKKLPKMLADPYIQLAKHPIEELTERPVSTALMLSPVGKVPVRTVGRAAAATGKRSLAGEPATLEGTSVRAQRHRSTDTARGSIRKPPKTMTEAEVNRRVDEAYDAAQLAKQRTVKAALAEGRTPKTARRRGNQQARRRFATEFGATAYVDPKTNAVIRPKTAPENSGVVHKTKADAQRVAERAPWEPKIVPVKGAGGGYAVVPKAAWDRWRQQQGKGTSKATPAITLRTANRLLKTAVLPVSPKWLGGQVGEALIRSAVMGVGPLSHLRGRKLLKALPDDVRAEVELRTTRGGQFGITGPAGEFAQAPRTFAQEFQHAGPRVKKVAEGATKVGALPGVRQLRGGYRRYAEAVFKINDQWEQAIKAGMLGKAVKSGPLMERSLFGITQKAIDDAADGLRGTSAQVELGRALDRAYGRYSKFSPEMRDAIMHWTPFVPWYLNMLRFTFDVLPRDHPVVTALLADASMATEEWRRQHDLSLHDEDHVPGFMLGSAPTEGGGYRRLSAFGPFVPAEPISAAVGNLLPVLRGPILAGAGVDFAGRELGEGEHVRGGAMALGVAESLVPGVSQVSRVTGLGERVRGRPKKADEIREKGIPQAVLDMLNPIKEIGGDGRKKKAKKKRRKVVRIDGGKLPLDGGGGIELLPLDGGKLPL